MDSEKRWKTLVSGKGAWYGLISMASLKHTRVGFLLIALAFAGLGLYLQSMQPGTQGGHTLSGVYFSKLLDNEVSVADLRAAAAEDEFRVSVGGTVEVAESSRSPFHVSITTTLAEEKDLPSAQERAVRLLSASLKEKALSEIESTLAYLERVETKAGELAGARRDSREQAYRPARPQARVSEKDTAKALLLRERIGQLEKFLAGGPLPATVRTQLDRQSLRNAELRVQGAKQELARLARTFSADSKPVRAQQELLTTFRKELTDLERELAGIYLRACKVELETLNDKAASLIESNARSLAQEKDSEKPDSSTEGSEWLSDRAKELHARADVIARDASLKLDGKLQAGHRTPTGRSYSIICWLAALGSVLGALFVSGEEREEKPVKRTEKSPAPVLKIELADRSAPLAPDLMEQFFAEIGEQMVDTLGREPSRLLILGQGELETRLSFSIRLANRLGRFHTRVRLIDFDHQERGLSRRLGRDMLPGVSELLASGGPVDEFFSSIAGTKIQFAPAGCSELVARGSASPRIDGILGRVPGEVCVIDAGAGAPLEILAPLVDAVLVVVDGAAKTEPQRLSALREVGLPVWGVSLADRRVYPLI